MLGHFKSIALLAGLQALAPVFAYFILGALLRALRFASPKHARIAFLLVFYVTLPALVFSAISGSTLTLNVIAFPVAGFLVNLACAMIAVVYSRRSGLTSLQTGTVVLGASMTNMLFMYPFILAVLGHDAFVLAALYDIGNGIFVATGSYMIAAQFGANAGSSISASIGRLFRSPLLLALLAAIIVSLNDWQVPSLIALVLTALGALTTPLVLTAMGVLYSPRRLADPIVYGTVSIRMLGGLLVGFLLVFAFGFQGIAAVVVIASASAPIGFSAATLASIGKLDVERATAALSLSVAIGLVTASAIVLIGAD